MAVLLGATSVVRAAALALAAFGAQQRVAAIPFTMNVLAAAIYSLQLTVGSAALAEATLRAQPHSPRLELLFSANVLLANGVAAAIGGGGALGGWGANSYFVAAAAMQATLVLPWLFGRGGDADNGCGCFGVAESAAPLASSSGAAEADCAATRGNEYLSSDALAEDHRSDAYASAR